MIRAQLHPQLIAELPRMFGGLQCIMTEVFQNASRAGAKNVSITNLDDHTLLIEDDGCGLDQPQELLEAGFSGWTGDVIDPAGLGIFSLFNSQLVKAVSFQSRHWLVRTTPAEVLGGLEIQVTSAPEILGFRVIIGFLEGVTLFQRDRREKSVFVDNPEALLKTARSYFPFELSYNSKIIPIAEHPKTLVVQGEYGTLEWGIDWTKRFAPVWQGQRLFGKNCVELLEKLAKQSQYPKLAARILEFSLVWRINPNSGLRPKLPDRHCLLETPLLERQLKTMLDDLLDAVIEHGKSLSKDWGEVVKSNDVKDDRFLYALSKRLLPVLGWYLCSTPKLNSVVFQYRHHEGITVDMEEVVVFDQGCILIQDQSTCDTINLLRNYGFDYPRASQHPSGLKTKIQYLRHDNPDTDLAVRLVQEIRVGNTELPFVWHVENDQTKPGFVLALNLHDALKVFRSNSQFSRDIETLIGLSMDKKGDLWDNDIFVSDEGFQAEVLRRLVIEQLVNSYDRDHKFKNLELERNQLEVQVERWQALQREMPNLTDDYALGEVKSTIQGSIAVALEVLKRRMHDLAA